MSSCLGCRVNKALTDAGLLEEIFLNRSGPKFTITGFHNCPVDSANKAAKEQPAPAKSVQPLNGNGSATTKKMNTKNQAPEPAKPPPKSVKPSPKMSPQASPAHPKGSGSSITPKPKAKEQPAVPAPKGKHSYHVAFIFPSFRDSREFFAMKKPAIFYILGGDVSVEMAQTEEYENALWSSVNPRQRGNLLAFRIKPFIFDDPVESLSRFNKLREIFKDVERVVEMDLETRDVLRLPNEKQPNSQKTEKTERPPRKDRPARKADPRPTPNGQSGEVERAEQTCYRCSTVGHISRDCPLKAERLPQEEFLATQKCFTCSEMGHLVRNCPSKPEKTAANAAKMECYECHAFGHAARDCPQKKSSRKPKETQNEATMICYNCQETGHLARNCTADPVPRVLTCRICKETGHNAKDCTQTPPPQVCYTCQEAGHVARDCPSRPAKKAERPPIECRSCHMTGHIARECPNPVEREQRPTVCSREQTRDGKVVLLGCGEAHSYNSCPYHLCVNCGDNHLSSRCPFMK
eukprot:NODE_1055_length_1684_cov_302.096981_g991_i0.p1 GENE.NODE_1055_length_1684_cov_302.096981_g991_i0~~NODE_1055_length_1684_cov_302.096981_g991_i0.p1  ORF type:complete len:521 (+),score=63.69 NODE_1055_length_1684_cov_302.096981_g991_i0:51-1613(+)